MVRWLTNKVSDILHVGGGEDVSLAFSHFSFKAVCSATFNLYLLKILEHSKLIVFIVRINHLVVFLLEHHPNIHFLPGHLL